ncbi:MAG: flavodoxin [Patescibacteria group bacterium]
MKKIVVFYSLTGNTRFIAQTIATCIGADVLKLKPKKEIAQEGFLKYFWGGKQVVLKEKPELLPLDKNPLDYDLIFLGTPVWSYTYSPVVSSFLAQIKLENKKIALWCCHGGSPRKTLENLKKRLVGNIILGQIDFDEPLKEGVESATRKVSQWAREIDLLTSST